MQGLHDSRTGSRGPYPQPNPSHPANMSAKLIASINSARILRFIPLTSSMVLTHLQVYLFPLSAGICLSQIIPHPAHGGLLMGDVRNMEAPHLPGMPAIDGFVHNRRQQSKADGEQELSAEQ